VAQTPPTVALSSGDRAATAVMEQLAIAGCSSMIAAACTNPIDVLKTRLQIDGAGTTACQQVHRGSFIQCARNLLSTEGVASLYRGVIPSLAREASYSSLRIGMYEPLRNFYASKLSSTFNDDHSSSLAVKVLAGGTTGAIGSAVANPCDLIKVKQQSFTGPLSNDLPLITLIRQVSAAHQQAVSDL